MTAGELLDQVRALYVDQFAAIAAELSQEGDELIFEPAFRDEHGKIIGDGALSLPLRTDLVLVRGGEAQEPTRVDSEKMLSFEPLSIEWPGGVELHLAPFHWDACQLRAVGIAVPIHWLPLKKWFNKWFDTEDTNPPDEQGFSNVVHFMSDPVLQGKLLTFSVDFGSAPVVALEELLDALRNLGAAEIEIGEVTE
jgi:hypothetical protein